MPPKFQEFLQQTFWQNTVADYLSVLATWVIGLIVVLIFKNIIATRLKNWAKKTNTNWDNLIIQILDRTIIPLLYVGVLYLSVQGLTLYPVLQQGINIICIALSTFFVMGFITLAIAQVLRYQLRRRGEEARERTVQSLLPAIRVVVWSIGIIFLLDNIGLNIGAVVAGLGIGGVAIALASRGVLEDLFSYLSIIFDRPFEIGDFIIVGEFAGTIERVGIKSTRIRSLSGEQLVFSNQDLTSSRVRNYQRMEQRRIAFQIGVTYETRSEQLQELPTLIQSIIEKQEGAIFDRAHFASYGDFSLNYEIVYYVTSNDYRQYMDIQQAINFELKDELEKRGIEFAYPTQVLYLNRPEDN
jgi:small-conductance mechanosensitive channel